MNETRISMQSSLLKTSADVSDAMRNGGHYKNFSLGTSGHSETRNT
jgi:hypothetical protein